MQFNIIPRTSYPFSKNILGLIWICLGLAKCHFQVSVTITSIKNNDLNISPLLYYVGDTALYIQIQ